MKLMFCGDTSFTGSFGKALKEKGNIISDDIQDQFRTAGFVIVNFEGPATTAQNNRKDLDVYSPIESIAYLKNCGVTHLSLANNHILDCGLNGLQDTINESSKHRMEVLGIVNDEGYSFEKIEYNGLTVGIITVTEFFPSMNVKGKEQVSITNGTLKNFIKSKRSSVDWLVLNYHGGEEYTVIPWPHKESLFKSFIDNGVDVVVGHHSHTFQKIKSYESKLVCHSLGNFIFDLSIHSKKSYINESAILTLNFTREDFDYSVTPVMIDTVNGIVDLASQPEKFDTFVHSNFGKKDWYKDCARVLSERNKTTQTKSSNQSRNKLVVLIRKVYTVLSNSEFRAIIFGAVLNKFIK